MKLVPGPLPPVPTGAMDRISLSMPFSPDLFWRYPLGFSNLNQLQQPPSSPLFDYKSQLPNSLASDPRVWSRDDVATFLRWAEREFDLQPIDMEMFQMNGKALCLLTRTDLSERAPGSGDVLYNVIQILAREANTLQRMLPSSPVTPTSRHPYPFSPHSHPPTPNWNVLSQNNDFHPSSAASIAAHLMAHSNSVTLSPAPSVDSQAGSPQHTEVAQAFSHYVFNSNGSSNGSGSNPSDSDEDAFEKNGTGSPPTTPSAYCLAPPASLATPKSPKEATSGPGVFKFMKREFFPNESSEPNTNGRLLWDFLQQLLNDPAQRYTSYIAWKNRETGVFKIVDPAGLAKLWGIQKNHLSMNYDKMSRALRYYYRVNILRKVQGERHCYQFLRNPTELKNIKNISLLRQQMSPTNTKPAVQIHPQITIKPEPLEPMQHDHGMGSHSFEAVKQEQSSSGHDYDEKPTDLSMGSLTADLNPKSRHSSSASCSSETSISVPSSLSSNRQISIVCSPDPPVTTTGPPQ